jgi:hypothetical protein
MDISGWIDNGVFLRLSEEILLIWIRLVDFSVNPGQAGRLRRPLRRGYRRCRRASWGAARKFPANGFSAAFMN